MSVDGRRRCLVRLPHRFLLGTLEAFLAAQVAAVVEHVVRVRMQRPVAAFAGSVGGPRHFDETVVEGQAVPDRVLPALLRLAVERKLVHDELVDLAKRAHLQWGRLC